MRDDAWFGAVLGDFVRKVLVVAIIPSAFAFGCLSANTDSGAAEPEESSLDKEDAGVDRGGAGTGDPHPDGDGDALVDVDAHADGSANLQPQGTTPLNEAAMRRGS